MTMRKTLEQRFWEKVDRKGDTDCWNWTAAVRGSTDKYGTIWVDGAIESAHRVAYRLASRAEIPEDTVVRHKCDNGLCCNPAHLELGTMLDNARDKVERGRSHNGGRGKLTVDQAVEILHMRFDLGLNNSQIARNYGITRPMVSRICNGYYWQDAYQLYQAQYGIQAA
jgi:hypothetical protein